MNISLLKIKKPTIIITLIFSGIIAILFYGCGQSPDSSKINKSNTRLIQVGVYSGIGTSHNCIIETLEALKLDSGIFGKKISPVNIQMGALDSLDVLIFPGGSGSKEYNSLG